MTDTMNVMFLASKDHKYLVEVGRYTHLGNIKKWCMAHPQAEVYIYHARPNQSHWLAWSHAANRPMRITGATLLEQCEVLNTEPVPFGNPDTWIALSD
jgi:hypothetical protein